MDLFKAEKVGEIEGNSIKECRVCGERTRLVRTVLTGENQLIYMFECECGERIWEE
jgi:hypothetical protein